MGNRNQLPAGMLHTIRIECNVTYRCNAICWGCNKAVGLARFPKTDMTVEQMRRAVNMLIEQKIHVPRFTFCGGEPCLHPQLQELINEVARLPTLRWGRVLTNAMPVSKPLRDKIVLPDRRFHWFENPLDNPEDPLSGKNDRDKRPNKRRHSPFWISPADVGKPADFDHCAVQGWCGIGLDCHGFSACGKATMFAKLLGVPGVATWEGDIMQHVKTPINDICKHCQYGLVDGKKGINEIDSRHFSGELPAVSKTFEQAFQQHRTGGDLVQLRVL